jgi:glycosyltransferase involved in cell wall biosynthesis
VQLYLFFISLGKFPVACDESHFIWRWGTINTPSACGVGSLLKICIILIINFQTMILENFTLITTIYNEEQTIIDFLDSYKNQSVFPREFIIVDGGSSDKCCDLITKYKAENDLNIRLLTCNKCNKKYSQSPIAKGRNLAIKESTTDYIIVTDAGCIMDENYIKYISLPFNDRNVDFVGGAYKPYIENEFSKIYYEIAMTKTHKIESNPRFVPSSRSFAFRKSSSDFVGGYPEIAYTAEDTFFVLKLQKHFIQKNTSKAIVFWRVPKDINEAKKKQFAYGYGNGITFGINKSFFVRLALIIFPLLFFVRRNHIKYFATSYALNFYNFYGHFKGLVSQ